MEQQSELEDIKAGSGLLRGRIAEELADDSDRFSNDTAQLLKHHGTYQQLERRPREVNPDGAVKTPKRYSMLVRSKVPGGKLSSSQFLAHLDLCDEYADGTLRVTSRQDLQLYGIAKAELRQVFRRINEIGLTTLGACGDVGRNVTCCPAPDDRTAVRGQMQELAARLSAALLPRCSTYGDIWLDDSGSLKKTGGDQECEPLYGESYLPRKFKIGIVLPNDNCADVYTNDLGLIAVCEPSREENSDDRSTRLVGYNLLVGGSLGVTPSRPDTFAALARELAFVEPQDVVDVTLAIVELFRDHGNRADRKRARLKYLIADWGLEKFKAELERRYGRALAEPREVQALAVEDHIGWHKQGDGLWYRGLYIENGRVSDHGRPFWKSALRVICETLSPGVRLTPRQSVLLTGISQQERQSVDDILSLHGVLPESLISNARRWAMACVALPTCPLAAAESERALPGIIASLEKHLSKLGLDDEVFTLRMTGCPNGCARPYNADIGLVGRALGKYDIHLGGRMTGDRLGFLWRDKVPLEKLVPTLVPILTSFQQERRVGESLGDFCFRIFCGRKLPLLSQASPDETCLSGLEHR